MTKYYNKDRSEHIKVPSLDVDVIALSLSGGADSTILAYIVAKDIVDKESNTRILPFTRRRPYPANNPRDWNISRASDVINKITEVLGKNVFLDHYIEQQPYGQLEKQTPIEEKEHLIILHEQLGEKITAMPNVKTWKYYYGVTANPSYEEMKNNNFLSEWRVQDRDNKNRKKRNTRPFDLVDKKFISELYEQTGMLDILFPLTFSCEGDYNISKNYTTHCEECWWCKERFWAFGRYV